MTIPRHSAEERAASFYRVTRKGLLPPSKLPHRAKAIWREIVGSKPIDFFETGQCGLLADYCETQSRLEECNADLRRLDLGSEESDRLFNRTIKLGQRMSRLAPQLRLTVQWSVERHSTKAGEAAPGLEIGGELIGGRTLGVGLN